MTSIEYFEWIPDMGIMYLTKEPDFTKPIIKITNRDGVIIKVDYLTTNPEEPNVYNL